MAEGEVEATQERDAGEKADDALGRLDATEVTRAVSAFARENPHVALAAAAGLGFLLGGGLTPRVLSRLGALATRSYVKGTFAQAVGTFFDEQARSQGQLGSSP
ncbi:MULTISPECIES: hypothetical protein [Sorangium]|uniref:Uncharacterized protein n=1 Tax=Sorangium cellulosum TaxID=56 RepID=A0A4P2R5M0_SORCE|nr:MULTISPECIES: hypothetical protein [Sorangium]AUX38078.1 hypothetical protein SOCE836_103170 [Sorangium cellulosum]WCQ97366.1 hypothetical protein NQZ70_10159 [Sorangium sp. Soce836]